MESLDWLETLLETASWMTASGIAIKTAANGTRLK
jgi:hypothetical protein